MNIQQPFEFNNYQAAWLSDLESGNIEQAFHTFGTKDFCCALGTFIFNTLGNEDLNNMYRNFDSKLCLRNWRHIATLNDTAKLTFLEIATKIRFNPRNYFTN